MATPIEAARAAIDELMEHATALQHYASDGMVDPDAKPQLDLVLAKARTARAALEVVLGQDVLAAQAKTDGRFIGSLNPETQKLARELADKAEGAIEQRDAERATSNRLRSPAVPIVGSERRLEGGHSDAEVRQEAELYPNTKPAGSAVSYGTVKPPRDRGGPKDADRAPTEFRGEFGPAGQIHPVANFQHCEVCGIRLDVERLDPCPRMAQCPHPRPQDTA